jgi:hypothetical protein
MSEINKQLQIALSEIGEIQPWWSDEDQMFIFEHPAYPRVSHADADQGKAKAGYLRALEGFIEDRLAGNLAEEAERVTSGRGGARPGAGRPRKPKTLQRRLDADMAEWLDEPANREKVWKLMQA